MADPDWSDPCAVLTWLRPQVFKIRAGLGMASVTHGDQSTTYNQANIRELGALMRELETECARKQGTTTGRRRAFRAG